MAASKSKKHQIYQRGGFHLGWDRRTNGSLRSPNLAIFWYDQKHGRIRSSSTGTPELDQAKLKLDILYLERSNGANLCHTCGHTLAGQPGLLVGDAIANYLVLEGSRRVSAEAISARLAHILNYLETLPDAGVQCTEVDEAWVTAFRSWALSRPVVGPNGKKRPRAPSTVENSVIQLRAALAYAHRRGDSAHAPTFRAQQPATVNRSPRWRANVQDLAAMLRYARSGGIRTEALYRYLLAAISTLARPDAVLEFSTSAERGQWHPERKALDLNPIGRQQTKKFRAVVCVPRQLTPWLKGTAGQFVQTQGRPVSSIQSAWATMRRGISLHPECTTKSIRRSMATLLRVRGVPVDQLEMQMGHRSLNATTQIYAPDDPAYLVGALAAIEAIIDELEVLAPGSFTGVPPDNKASARESRAKKA